MKIESKTLTVSIDRDPDEVYGFVSNPENFPKWAPGFCKSIRRVADTWIAETSAGPMPVRFAKKNAFRVADHYVMTPTGAEVYVPLRVLANGASSAVVFTLFPQPAMTAEKFQEDARLVQQDLNTLKRILEEQPPARDQ